MTDTAAASSHPPAAGRSRSWRRRALRWLIVLGAVLVAVRIAFTMLLPAALNRLAGLYGFTAEYDRSELNLLSGDAGLWYLRFTPKSGGEPVLKIDYVRGNISVLALLRLRLEVWRAEADGVELLIERSGDGRFPLFEQLLARTPPVTQAPNATQSPHPPQPVDLAPPLFVEALRLQNAVATLRDHTFTPALQIRARLDLRLSDLGSPTRPTRLDLSLWTDPGLDLLRVEGSGRASAEKLDASLHFVLRGLSPEALRAYLNPIGLEPLPGTIAGQGHLQATLHRHPTTPGVVAGQVVVRDVSLRTTEQTAVAVNAVKIGIDSLNPTAAHLGTIRVEKAEVALGRSPRGRLEFAGIELAGRPDGSSPTEPADQPLPATRPGASFAWSVARVDASGATIRFTDRASANANPIRASLPRFEVQNLSWNPARPNVRASVAMEATVSDLVDSARLSGNLTLAPDPSLTLDVTAAGLRGDALRPYLAAAGVEPTIAGGSFACRIVAERRETPDGAALNAKLENLTLRDASGELLSLPAASIKGLRVAPGLKSVSVGTIELVGPSLPARLDTDGMLSVLGVRTLSATAAARTGDPPSAVAEEGSIASLPVRLPAVRLGRFKWTGIALNWTDASSPASSIRTEDAGFELEDLVLDLTGQAPGSNPGKFRGWAVIPGVAERLEVEGNIQSRDRAATVSMRIKGEGISARALAPYLRRLALEPAMESGAFRASASINLRQVQESLLFDLECSDISFADGERSFLTLGGITMTGGSLSGEELNLGTIEIDSPRLAVRRNPQGQLTALGLKLLPPPPTPQRNASPPSSPASNLLPLAIPVNLPSASVRAAQLDWTDEMAGVAVGVTADVSLAGLRVAQDLRPGKLQVKLGAGQLARDISLAGDLTLSPRQAGFSGQITADGLKPGPLAAYLPAGAGLSLSEGKFRVRLDAGLGMAAAGGYCGHLIAEDLEYRDQDQLLAQVRSFRFAADRIDPSGGVIAIREVSSSGVEATCELRPDGSTQFLGLLLHPDPSRGSNRDEAASSPVPFAAEPSAAPVTDPKAIVAAAEKPLPLLTVDRLDLRLDRLTVVNRRFDEAAPVTVSNLQLQTLNRLEWAGPEPQKHPPTKLRFSCGLSPLVESVTTEATLAPFAADPSATIDLRIDGVRGEGIPELLPPVRPWIDGTRLVDGRFRTRVEVHLHPDRRGGGPADYSRGFGADIIIDGTEFGRGDGGDVLAGVDRIRLDQARIEPLSGNITVKTLEINRPAAQLIHDEQGLEAFGLVLKLPKPAAKESGDQQARTEPIAEESPQTMIPAARPEQRPASASGGEIRLDRVLISGLDVRLEDRTVDPPILLPLNGLDVDASGLSSRLMSEPRTVRFDAVLSAGQVTLPRKLSGGIAGALGDLGAVLAGKAGEIPTQPELEDRPLFSQAAASGRLALFPQPAGWLKASLNGLEL
ncbi:MAG: DUF748 domain-containing protein, partial [Phycisphaerales bacterium]|nr:DUF748 domain-containing protein [Phycisphaerales bacterium]